MIKNIFLICIIGIILIVSGCSGNLKPQSPGTGSDVENNSKTNDTNAQENVSVRPGSLGGICLGDSPEDVQRILGKDYTESMETDVSGYIKEDMIVWSFSKGIVVTIGKESKKVISVVSHSQDYKTDLGIKVGDQAKTLFEKYKPKFAAVISRHSNEVLDGWFNIGDGKIIIFRFDENNNTDASSTVPPDAAVQEIELAYWEHFD